MTTLENITCLPVKLECHDSMNTLESTPTLTRVFAWCFRIECSELSKKDSSELESFKNNRMGICISLQLTVTCH